MTDEQPLYKPSFGLRPLGYSRRNVEVAFAEGRMALRQLRGRVEELSGQVAKLERELEQRRSELEAARAREHEIQRLTIAAEQKAAAIEDEARSRSREITAAAEERAALIRGEAGVRAEEISQQIDELLRIREELVRSVRASARHIEEAVGRVERGEAAPDDAAAPATPAPGGPDRQSAASPPAAERQRESGGALFESRVEIDAGPFADFAELSAFERTLSRMPKVQDVYIRRFSDERATIELTLVEPAPLLDLLGDVMPHGFDVVASTAASLKVSVLSPPRVGSR